MSAAATLWNRLWIREGEDRPGEKGAIMVMGIFLACSMIAAMWYMMGIGDAILWRDRQQEAADSIAFTSAAIHARGMNFIAMINILMLLIVAVYLIACIIRTILDLILYISGDDTSPYCWPIDSLKYTEGHGAIGALGTITGFFTSPKNAPRYGDCKCGSKDCGDPAFYVFKTIGKVSERVIDNSAGRDLAIALGCAPCWACIVCFIPKCIASHPMHDIADRVGPIYEKVEWFITKWEKNIMKPVMPKMHTVEVATAVLTPWLGAAFSAYAGAQYKDGPNQDPNNKIMHKGIAFSPSMFRKLKKPQKIKKLRDDLDWIPCATQQDCGNGCGPTLCKNGKVSRSGPKKNGTSGTTAECCGANESGCNNSGTCSKNGGIAADQSGLYEEVTIDDSKDYRIGLPVQAENNAELCQKAFSYLGDEVSNLVSDVSGMGNRAKSDGSTADRSGNKNGGGTTYSSDDLIQKVFNSAGGWFKTAYCSYDPAFSAAHSLDSGNYEDVFPGRNGSWDGNCSTQVCAGQKCPDDSNDFWAINDDDDCPFKGEFGHSIPLLFDGKHLGGNGPMKVVPYAPNGGDYNQIYSVVINDNYNPVKGEYGTSNDQTSWSKIRLAVGPAKWGTADESMFSLVDGDNTIGSAIVGGNGNGPWFYLAEAEFYHDCENAWDDNACNGGDHSTYRLNWRTRLRRVHKPIYIQELTSKIPGSLTTIAQKATANQWAINNISTTYLGIDLGTLFNYFELLAELGSNDPNGLMKPIYH